MTFKVTAALVTATTKSGTAFNLYREDLVPDDISDKSRDHLLALEFIAEGEPEGPSVAKAPAPKPAR